MNTPRRALLAVVIGLAVLAAGCGDSGTTTTTGSTNPVESFDIEIVAVDFAFDPESWTVATADGATVKLDNRGTLEHNWDILSTPITAESELTDDLILWEIAGASDTTTTGTIDLPLAPGTYQIVCTIAGHFSAGMVGELTVTG